MEVNESGEIEKINKKINRNNNKNAKSRFYGSLLLLFHAKFTWYLPCIDDEKREDGL